MNNYISLDSYISLDNLRIYAYHGVFPEERAVGTDFIINLRMKVRIEQASLTDDVADTVSYADVCEVVKQEMDIPSNLLEYVCGRIVRRLFVTFPAIENIELKLSKCRPPMDAQVDSASVELHASRG
ncbi:MAG: dihydroneopterin aldolase [Mediterranea sp.]|jgi:dihydroneopterin aldolase|nr:dihydroneopterin aldolase [Mediterranea sp.]